MKYATGFIALTSIGALLAGWLSPTFSLEVRWLLLGVHLGIDSINRPFLLVTGLVWLIACLFSFNTLQKKSNNVRHNTAYYLVSVSSIIAILSQDIITFYCAYALMSISAYLLVLTDRDPSKKKAGTIYLTLAFFGELLLFTAMVGLIHLSNTLVFSQLFANAIPDWIILFIIFGFGIKLGLFPLHVTLPLIYKSAPLANGIALAGAAINIGLLGWIRWLPFSESTPWIGLLLIGLGIFGYLYAITIGLIQSHARALLGYSSISQMGLVSIVIGAALINPKIWNGVLSGVLLMMLHHAIAKTYLFVASNGVPTLLPLKIMWWIGAIIAGIGLAGAPMTGGYYAKELLNHTSAQLPALAFLSNWLWISSILTTFLIMRFLWIVQSKPRTAFTFTQSLGSLIAFLSILTITGHAILERPWMLLDISTAFIPILFAIILMLLIPSIKPINLILNRLCNINIPPGDIAIFCYKTLIVIYKIASSIFTSAAQRIAIPKIFSFPHKSLLSPKQYFDAPSPKWSNASLLLLTLIVLLMVGMIFSTV